jgi:hypothetical protein
MVAAVESAASRRTAGVEEALHPATIAEHSASRNQVFVVRR